MAQLLPPSTCCSRLFSPLPAARLISAGGCQVSPAKITIKTALPSPPLQLPFGAKGPFSYLSFFFFFSFWSEGGGDGEWVEANYKESEEINELSPY